MHFFWGNIHINENLLDENITRDEVQKFLICRPDHNSGILVIFLNSVIFTYFKFYIILSVFKRQNISILAI